MATVWLIIIIGSVHAALRTLSCDDYNKFCDLKERLKISRYYKFVGSACLRHYKRRGLSGERS